MSTHFLLKTIHKINVLGSELLLLPDEKGMPMVEVVRLCDAIGANWQDEMARLEADKRLGAYRLQHRYPDGKSESLAVIPLNKLHAFLFTMDEYHLNPTAKAKLALFQAECVDVLSDYWNKGAAINDRLERGSTESAKYKDCRAQSRPELISAIKRLVDYDKRLDPNDVYEYLIGFCWDMLGNEGPIRGEDQKLSDQVNGIHGVNAYLLAEMERTAVRLIDMVIEEDRDTSDVVNYLEENIRLAMAQLGDKAFSIAQ